MNLNIGDVCSGQQCRAGLAQKVALRLIDPGLCRTDYTFEQLDKASNQVANVLTKLGINPQDRVYIFLPKQAEVFFSFLGILKKQAIACILFSNFGKEAVSERLIDGSAKVLITKQSLFNKVCDICPSIPSLEKVILTDISQHENEWILSYTQLIAESSSEFEILPTEPETPSVLHYTSGSTGRPKGVLHVHSGLQYQIKTMEQVFQIEPEDIYWCTADQAWVTGVTYGIIGPWAKGITQIHYTGKFDAVDWFNLLKQEKVTIWYTAPTALRMLIQDENKLIGKYLLPSLKRVYSVGEPLNPEIINWVRGEMHKEIYDTWFQTETGAIMISNQPGLEVKPGSMGKPVAGIEACVLNEDYTSLPPEQAGSLCLKKGWPSMFRTYLNMEEQYQSKFHGEFYNTGDQARMDVDGYFWFIGRNDDVINTSGHLVGPFEVESVLLEMDEIVDVAVIGAPDDMLFEKIVAFVKLKVDQPWTKTLEVQARIRISRQLSPIAVPSEFVVVERIPKNRSGKIMRRVLKAQYTGQEIGDISTMED
jgi:acetyl-CoA synthetase